jgi:hypothetical protein
MGLDPNWTPKRFGVRPEGPNRTRFGFGVRRKGPPNRTKPDRGNPKYCTWVLARYELALSRRFSLSREITVRLARIYADRGALRSRVINVCLLMWTIIRNFENK